MKHHTLSMKSLILFISLFFMQSAFAQRNYNQELLSYTVEQNAFFTKDYYIQYKDSLELEWASMFYAAMSNCWFNKPDSAIPILKNLLSEPYISEYDTIKDKDFMYALLLHCYFVKRDYANVIDLFDEMIVDTIYNEQEQDAIKQKKKFYQTIDQAPKIEIVNTEETEDVHIKMDTQEGIVCNVRYNNVYRRTLFDTGNQLFCFVEQEVADSMGVKMVGIPYTANINCKETIMTDGIVDSVWIGTILIKNMPVVVFKIKDIDTSIVTSTDSIAINSSAENNQLKIYKDSVEETFKPLSVIMGLPLMKLLNHIQLNTQSNEMVISLNRKDKTDKESNMFLAVVGDNPGEFLFVQFFINEIGYMAYFDSGDMNKIISIHDFIYEYCKDFLPSLDGLDTTKEVSVLFASSTIQEYRSIKIPDIQVSIGDKLIDLHNESNVSIYDNTVVSDCPATSPKGHAQLGSGILRKCTTITLDFHNMRILCE
jgi:predicted aspartyl protease